MANNIVGLEYNNTYFFSGQKERQRGSFPNWSSETKWVRAFRGLSSVIEFRYLFCFFSICCSDYASKSLPFLFFFLAAGTPFWQTGQGGDPLSLRCNTCSFALLYWTSCRFPILLYLPALLLLSLYRYWICFFSSFSFLARIFYFNVFSPRALSPSVFLW